MNQRAPNVDYTPWHILEHLRITQWDMLSYIRDGPPTSRSDWPIDYWPAKDAETDEEGFQRTIDGFRSDLRELQQIAADESVDLSAVLEGTPGHTALPRDRDHRQPQQLSPRRVRVAAPGDGELGTHSHRQPGIEMSHSELPPSDSPIESQARNRPSSTDF